MTGMTEQQAEDLATRLVCKAAGVRKARELEKQGAVSPATMQLGATALSGLLGAGTGAAIGGLTSPRDPDDPNKQMRGAIAGALAGGGAGLGLGFAASQVPWGKILSGLPAAAGSSLPPEVAQKLPETVLQPRSLASQAGSAITQFPFRHPVLGTLALGDLISTGSGFAAKGVRATNPLVSLKADDIIAGADAALSKAQGSPGPANEPILRTVRDWFHRQHSANPLKAREILAKLRAGDASAIRGMQFFDKDLKNWVTISDEEALGAMRQFSERGRGFRGGLTSIGELLQAATRHRLPYGNNFLTGFDQAGNAIQGSNPVMRNVHRLLRHLAQRPVMFRPKTLYGQAAKQILPRLGLYLGLPAAGAAIQQVGSDADRYFQQQDLARQIAQARGV